MISARLTMISSKRDGTRVPFELTKSREQHHKGVV